MLKQDEKINLIISIPLIIGVFSCTFVNDYAIGGIFPAFYISWLLVAIVRMVGRISLKKEELRLQIFLFLIFSPLLLLEYFYGVMYYCNAYIFISLYVNILYVFPFLRKHTVELLITSVFFFLIIFFYSLYSIFFQHQRLVLFFGPNVFYRINGFFFSLIFISLYYARKNSVFFSGLFFIYFVIMISTGSRASLAVFIAHLLYVVKIFKIKTKRFFVMLFLLLLSFFYFAHYFTNTDVGRRIFYFNLSNESESIRLDFYEITYNFLIGEEPLNLIKGVTSFNDYTFTYPHNIFLESIIYGGFYCFSFIFLSYFLFLFFIKKEKENPSLLTMPFIPIFTGALFSGNLFYNFPTISVGFLMLRILFLKKGRDF